MGAFIDDFLEAVRNIDDYSRVDELIIQGRFIAVVSKAEKEARLTSILYYLMTNMITVGGIIIVSLLAIVKLEGVSDEASTVLHWLSWTIAAIVSIGNKLLYEFSIPKKFITYARTREKFYSEAWSLVSAIGHYENIDSGRERLQLFYSRIEKIKTKMVDNVLVDVDRNAVDKLGLSTSIDRLVGAGRTPPESADVSPSGTLVGRAAPISIALGGFGAATSSADSIKVGEKCDIALSKYRKDGTKKYTAAAAVDPQDPISKSASSASSSSVAPDLAPSPHPLSRAQSLQLHQFPSPTPPTLADNIDLSDIVATPGDGTENSDINIDDELDRVIALYNTINRPPAAEHPASEPTADDTPPSE